MKKNFISLSLILTAPHSFQPNLLNFNGMSMQKKTQEIAAWCALVKLNANDANRLFFLHIIPGIISL